MTPEEIFSKMQALIVEKFMVSEDEVTMNSSFVDDFGADSVDLVDLVMSMEDEFGIDEINEEELAQLKTVGSCVKYLLGKLN